MFNFKHQYTLWVLIALVIVAGAVRFWMAAYTSLGFEEQMLWFIGAKHSILDSIENIWYYKPTGLILGITAWLTNYQWLHYEILSRLISYLAGIAAVPFIFYLARKFYGEIEGLLAAAFIAVSWLCIDVSTTVSIYSLLLMLLIAYFLSLMSFFDDIAEERVPKVSTTITFVATGLLLGITSVWGIISIAISFFYTFFFITKPKQFFAIFSKFTFILIPMALLVWVYFQYDMIFEAHSIDILASLLALNTAIADNYVLTGVVVLPLLWLAGIYIKKLIYIKILIKTNEERLDIKKIFANSTLLLTIWFVCSIAATLLLPYYLHIKYDISDLVFCIPPLAILVARSIVLFSQKVRRQLIIGGVLIASIILASYLNLSKLTDYTDYNQATHFIMHASVLYDTTIIMPDIVVIEENCDNDEMPAVEDIFPDSTTANDLFIPDEVLELPPSQIEPIVAEHKPDTVVVDTTPIAVVDTTPQIKITQRYDKSYGVLFSGNTFPKQAFSYYLQKNNIHLKYFSFDGNLMYLSNILSQAKNVGITKLWYIVDETITDASVIPNLIANGFVIEGYRYRNITLLLLSVR
ncbi:MAG: hypothetical protein LBO69_07385 [Ignavibacteria bacterium]|jgi:hypothetical protein|nr:hypothetical protein [Ignavibacteria bacterium]